MGLLESGFFERWEENGFSTVIAVFRALRPPVTGAKVSVCELLV